jgi:hypothetical protein
MLPFPPFSDITVLASPSFAVLYADFTTDRLIKFVEDTWALYGNDILVYNLNGLGNLADVKLLIQLCPFPFYNMLGQLKKMQWRTEGVWRPGQ